MNHPSGFRYPSWYLFEFMDSSPSTRSIKDFEPGTQLDGTVVLEGGTLLPVNVLPPDTLSFVRGPSAL